MATARPRSAGSTNDEVVHPPGCHRLQARSTYPNSATSRPTSRIRAVNCGSRPKSSSWLLPASGGHRRDLRRRRLLQDGRHHGRDRAGPAGIRRPPQERAEARPGRVRGGGATWRRSSWAHPPIQQIFVYGTSARAYLLARDRAQRSESLAPHREPSTTGRSVKPALREALRGRRRRCRPEQLNADEMPRDCLSSRSRSAPENGLLAGIDKHLRPRLKARYARTARTALRRPGRGAEPTACGLCAGARRDGPVVATRRAGRAGHARRRRPPARGCPTAALHRPRRGLVVRIVVADLLRGDLRYRGAGRDAASSRRAACSRSPAGSLNRARPGRSGRRSHRCTAEGHQGSEPGELRSRGSSTRRLWPTPARAAPASGRRSRSPVRTATWPFPVPWSGSGDWPQRRPADLPLSAAATRPPLVTAGGPFDSGDIELPMRLFLGAGRRPPRGAPRVTSTSRNLVLSGDLAAPGRTVDQIVHPAALVNHVAAVQRTVRAERCRYGRADPPGADHTAEALRLPVVPSPWPPARAGVFDEEMDMRAGGGTSDDERLRERLCDQQVGRRGAAPRGPRPLRAAGDRLPFRDLPRPPPLGGRAQCSRHVHPPGAQPDRTGMAPGSF